MSAPAVSENLQDSYNDGNDYREKYTSILLRKEYKKFQSKLLESAKHNHQKKMSVLLSLLKEFKLEPLSIPVFSEINHLLHTIIIFSDSSEYKCFELAAEKCENLVFCASGASRQLALHVAVARMNLNVVEVILRVLKKSGEATYLQYIHTPLDSQSDASLQDTCMEAELPLSIAAWNADLDMIELLMEMGCQLSKQNTMGDNVFHTIVKISSRYRSGSDADADRIQHLINAFQQIKDKQLHGISTDKKQQLSFLLNAKNVDGFTPLSLAAKLAAGRMYVELINCLNIYKFLDMVDGVSNRYLYDITDIDSALSKGKSVMEMMSTHGEERVDDYQHFTETSPILDIIKEKWKNYRKYYYTWCLVHILMCTGPVVHTYVSKSSTYCFRFDTSEDKLLSIWQIAFLIYTLLLIISECLQVYFLRRAGNLNIRYFINPLGNGPFHILLVSFASLATGSVVLFLIRHKSAQILITVALILGWLFTLYFTRGIKTFSSFTVILLEALFKDMGRMVFVYIMILIPFSAGMSLEFMQLEHESFRSIPVTLFFMFKLTLGISEPPAFERALHPAGAQILYIVYLVLSYLLLLNVLIALLSETAIRISTNQSSRWHLQKLNIILYLENRLPQRLKHICGNKKSSKLFPKIEDIKSHLPSGFSEFDVPKQLEKTVSDKISSKRYYLKVNKASPHRDCILQRKSKIKNTAARDIHERNLLLHTGVNPLNTNTQELQDINHLPLIPRQRPSLT